MLLHPGDDLLPRDAVVMESLAEGLQSSATAAAAGQSSCLQVLNRVAARCPPSVARGWTGRDDGCSRSLLRCVSVTEGDWKDGDPAPSLDGDETRWLCHERREGALATRRLDKTAAYAAETRGRRESVAGHGLPVREDERKRAELDAHVDDHLATSAVAEELPGFE